MLFFKKSIYFAIGILLSFNVYSIDMVNQLSHTGFGQPNPAYNKKIKNIMIFHVGGWRHIWCNQYGLTLPAPGGGLHQCENNNYAYPTYWGSQINHNLSQGWGPDSWPANPNDARGYLFRGNDVFLKQMEQMAGLGHTAVGVLLMPSDELYTGYGAYWNEPGNAKHGRWLHPEDMFDGIRWAAWKHGMQVAPFISLQDYDNKGPKGVYEDLVRMVNFVTSRNDLTTLKTTDGKHVILVEGLPSQTDLKDDVDGIPPCQPGQTTNCDAQDFSSVSAKYRNDILNFMASRTDIVWIDNLIADCPTAAANIHVNTATLSEANQDAYKQYCGDRFHWTLVQRYATQNIANPTHWATHGQVLKHLNISPHYPSAYPSVIYQWNEYGESEIFEPNSHDGTSIYDYLKWRISQQPD